MGRGSTYTLVDKSVVVKIGSKFTGKKVKLVVADGHEVVGELAIVDKLIVEGEELPGAHVAAITIPEKLKEQLRKLGLSQRIIVGITTLEMLGLAPNTKTGKLEKVEIPII